jgi:serine/threonine-protein phosphatase CPPED1
MIQSILTAMAFAAALAAQTAAPPPVAVPPTFIQMSDPQFGMFTNNKGFEHETANFEFAIATANRLKPAFVIVTGDLINQSTDGAQAAEYKRIVAKLNPAIKLYSVPGNHDVGNEPTKASLARYRERFGEDYFTFRAGDMEGIVLNSNLEKGAEGVPDEASKMEAWLKTQLAAAQQAGVKQIIVFQHIPFFLKTADEPDQYFNIPKETRARYLKILHQYGVKQVFAGHLHHNSEGRDGDLEMYTTGPVGKPLDGGKSGMRFVVVKDGAVVQKYYDFGELPQ